jgi:hypothetical protein
MTTARFVLRASRLAGLALGACWLSACGGQGHKSVASSEQAALALLQQTTIPRRIFALSYQEDESPTTCLVVPEEGQGDRFDLFVTWKPDNVIDSRLPRSVVLASISDASAKEDTYTVATYKDRLGKPVSLSPRVLAAFDRASLDPSAGQCEVLADEHIQLVGAGKP